LYIGRLNCLTDISINMTKQKHPGVHAAVDDGAELVVAVIEGFINFIIIGGFKLLTHILLAFIFGKILEIVGLSVVLVTESIGDIIEGVLDIEQIFVDAVNFIINFLNNIGNYILNMIKNALDPF